MTFLSTEHDIRQFDPSRVRMRVLGIELTGFAQKKVSIKQKTDTWKLVTGCEGETTRVKSLDTSGTITVTLQQTSPSNQFLSTLYFLDRQLAVPVPVWIYYEGDSFGESIFGLSTKIISLQTWIKKLPDINYSNKLDETVWEFESDNLLYFLFGNDKPENGSFELGDGSPEPFEEDGSKLGINYLSKNNTANFRPGSGSYVTPEKPPPPPRPPKKEDKEADTTG